LYIIDANDLGTKGSSARKTTRAEARLKYSSSPRNRASEPDLAIFNLAIDGKLRACDLVKLRPHDICLGVNVRRRATIVKKKTGLPLVRGLSRFSGWCHVWPGRACLPATPFRPLMVGPSYSGGGLLLTASLHEGSDHFAVEKIAVPGEAPMPVARFPRVPFLLRIFGCAAVPC
jgi:hypothetical protein